MHWEIKMLILFCSLYNKTQTINAENWFSKMLENESSLLFYLTK